MPPSTYQEKLAEVLVSGQVKTLKKAGEIAGYGRPPSAHRALMSANGQLALEKAIERKAKKERGYRVLGDKLIRSGVDQSEVLDPLAKISAGGALVKLGYDVDAIAPDGVTDVDRAQYARHLLRAIECGSNWYRRGKLERAMRLLAHLAGVPVALGGKHLVSEVLPKRASEVLLESSAVPNTEDASSVQSPREEEDARED